MRLALALLLSTRIVVPAAPPEPPADFVIDTQAKWNKATWPGGLDTAGGYVDVVGVDFDPVTLSNINPTGPLVFRKRSGDAQLPSVRMVLTNVSNLTFKNIRVFSNSWQDSPEPCLKFTGTFTSIAFDDCEVFGNYRGLLNTTYDPSQPLPEMHGIYGKIVSGGVQFSTTYVNGATTYDAKWIGDRLAPGSYSAVVTATGGAGAECNFTVDGSGNIGITSQNPGSGYTDTRAEMYTVRLPDGGSGMRVLRELMPDGIEADGTASNNGLIFRRCHFDMLNNAVRPTYPQAGVGSNPMIFEDCIWTRIHMDYVASGDGDFGARDVIFRGGHMTTPFGLDTDMQNPHGDRAQNWSQASPVTAGPNLRWIFEAVTMSILTGRGRPQGLFLTNKENGNRTQFAFRICGCTILTDGNWPIKLTNPDACFLYRNTVVLERMALAGSTPVRINLDGTAGEPSFIGNCITEEIVKRSFDVAENNLLLTPANSAAYSAAFADPHGSFTTLAGIEAAFTTLPAHAGKGAVGSDGYRINGRVDRNLEPTVVLWDNLLNVVGNTLVTGQWRCCLPGGPEAGRDFTVNTGELWEADNSAGTGAVQLSSPFRLTPGKYYWPKHMSSATPGATLTQTFTPVGGGRAITFASTTAATVAGYRGRFGTDETVNAGTYYEELVDIGAPHVNRVVTIETTTGSNNIANDGDVLLGGVATARRLGAGTAFQMHTIAVGEAGGVTQMLVRVNNNAAGSFNRCRIGVHVTYPAGGSATPHDGKSSGVVTGTGTATATGLAIPAGGYVIAFCGYTAVNTNTLSPTWSGTDTLVQDDQYVSENATPIYCGHVNVSETTTRNFALPANGSGGKIAMAISFPAPA